MIYGITYRFWLPTKLRIDKQQIEQQYNLVKSMLVVREEVPIDIIKLMLMLQK